MRSYLSSELGRLIRNFAIIMSKSFSFGVMRIDGFTRTETYSSLQRLRFYAIQYTLIEVKNIVKEAKLFFVRFNNRRFFIIRHYQIKIIRGFQIQQFTMQRSQKIVSLVQYFLKLNHKTYNPVLVTDIDGVLVRGSTPIPTTLQALHKIKEHNLPFACLTNGGGQLQNKKADKMNKIFGLNNYFTGSNMFMNHTPLKPQIVQHSKKGQWILVTGSLQIQEILQDLGVKNYITCDQFYTLFHQKDQEIDLEYIQQNQPYSFLKARSLKVDQVKAIIQKRINCGIPDDFSTWIQKIGAIFAMNDVSPYETALQVIHNVLKVKKQKNLPLPPYFAAQNDIIWAGGYKRPRMAFGPFNYILKNHCERNGFDLEHIYFGKPEKKAFKFVEDQLRRRINKEQLCFFMVGDNPRADICGANRAEWASFLTQTGVHHGDQNDTTNPATVVVQDFNQAVDLIFELKKNI